MGFPGGTQGKQRSVFLAQGHGWMSFWLTLSDARLCIVLGFTILASLATQTIKNLAAAWKVVVISPPEGDQEKGLEQRIFRANGRQVGLFEIIAVCVKLCH